MLCGLVKVVADRLQVVLLLQLDHDRTVGLHILVQDLVLCATAVHQVFVVLVLFLQHLLFKLRGVVIFGAKSDGLDKACGLDSLHTVKLLSFAKSILPHFFAFFQRQFSTKIPRRMHGQNAYTKQKEEHRSAPRCELLQFSPASCRRL